MGVTEDRLDDPHALALAAQGVLMAEVARLMAHELSQPLAAISMDAGAAARWLRHEPPAIAEAEAAVQRIGVQARAAGEGMRQILSRLQARPAPRRALDLDRIFAAAVRFARPTLDAHGIAVECRPVQLARPPVGDEVQVYQVVSCLLDNAIAAARACGGEKRIVLSAHEGAPGHVEVVVRDHGDGVPAASRGGLFDAFATSSPGTAGLGLAMCRTIAESHGGRVWLDEGAPTPGATFRFALPTRP